MFIGMTRVGYSGFEVKRFVKAFRLENAADPLGFPPNSVKIQPFWPIYNNRFPGDLRCSFVDLCPEIPYFLAWFTRILKVLFCDTWATRRVAFVGV